MTQRISESTKRWLASGNTADSVRLKWRAHRVANYIKLMDFIRSFDGDWIDVSECQQHLFGTSTQMECEAHRRQTRRMLHVLAAGGLIKIDGAGRRTGMWVRRIRA